MDNLTIYVGILLLCIYNLEKIALVVAIFLKKFVGAIIENVDVAQEFSKKKF